MLQILTKKHNFLRKTFYLGNDQQGEYESVDVDDTTVLAQSAAAAKHRHD